MKLWGCSPRDVTPDLREIIGDSRKPGKLRISGPYFYKQNGRTIQHFLPAPCTSYRLSSKELFQLMQPHKEVSTTLNGQKLCYPWIPSVEEDVEVAEHHFIEISEIQKLQEGKGFSLINGTYLREELFVRDTRVGIALDEKAKRAKDHMLYTLVFHRFRPGAGYLIFADEYTANTIKELKTVFLGSKSRTAMVEVSTIDTDVFAARQSGDLALCTTTPTVFDGGAFPKSMRISNAPIVGAGIPRKLAVSGWDLEMKQPKPIKHVVPAGAVYYVDGEFNYPESISDEYSELGYGRYFTVPWEYIRRG
jgi:CRISPR-associated protein Cmr3